MPTLHSRAVASPQLDKTGCPYSPDHGLACPIWHVLSGILRPSSILWRPGIFPAPRLLPSLALPYCFLMLRILLSGRFLRSTPTLVGCAFVQFRLGRPPGTHRQPLRQSLPLPGSQEGHLASRTQRDASGSHSRQCLWFRPCVNRSMRSSSLEGFRFQMSAQRLAPRRARRGDQRRQ